MGVYSRFVVLLLQLLICVQLRNERYLLPGMSISHRFRDSLLMCFQGTMLVYASLLYLLAPDSNYRPDLSKRTTATRMSRNEFRKINECLREWHPRI